MQVKINYESADRIEKFSEEGEKGRLLYAMKECVENLEEYSNSSDSVSREQKNDTGDIISDLDDLVHKTVKKYFEREGIGVKIIGEEGEHTSKRPEYSILLDEIEGTQNSVNGLDFGINMAIAPVILN